MSSIDVLREWKRSNPGIKNVVVFVSDALRWDYLPESLAKRGVAYKTVAASLWTASSFPSMVTGLNPNRHGVYSFEDRLGRGTNSLLNVPGYNTSQWNENTWIKYDPPESNPLHRLLRQEKRIPIDSIATPFIYVEDEKGGHAPYGWTSQDSDYEEYEALRFFRDYGRRSREDLTEKYRQGVNRSIAVFEKRMECLTRRGLMDETIVVFTSDHGQLLGEYGGHVGHEDIACPEVVYVPTVFIHPALPSGYRYENDGIMRHVDLYPTLMDILNQKVQHPIDGISMITAARVPKLGYNYMELTKTVKLMIISISIKHKETSVWDVSGGHVFRSGNLIERLLYSMYRTVMHGATREYLKGSVRKKNVLLALKDLFEVFKWYLYSYVKHGNPTFGLADAKMVMNSRDSAELDKTVGAIDELKRKGMI